jgi:hypothetical protein
MERLFYFSRIKFLTIPFMSHRFLVVLIFIAGGLMMASCQKDYNDPGTAASPFYGSRSAVAIRAIVLAQMPLTDPSGNPWDTADTIDTLGLPDVYYRIKDADSTNFTAFNQPFHFENLNADSLPIPYFLTTPYQLRAFGSNVQLDIYDFEKDPSSANVDSTLMKSFLFSVAPGDSTIQNPYPDSLLLNEDGYALFIYLNWIK